MSDRDLSSVAVKPLSKVNYQAFNSYLNTADRFAPTEVARAVHALKGDAEILAGVVRCKPSTGGGAEVWCGLWLTEKSVIRVEASGEPDQWASSGSDSPAPVDLDAWVSPRSTIQSVRFAEHRYDNYELDRVIVRGRSITFTDGSRFAIDLEGWSMGSELADDLWDVLTA